MRLVSVVILLFAVQLVRANIGYGQDIAADTVLIDTDSSFDVDYVKLDLWVQPDTEYLAGYAELRSHANALRPDSTIRLSLRPQLSVDSIFVGVNLVQFNHYGDKLFVTLDKNYSPNSIFDLVIYYHGYSTMPDRYGIIHSTQIWDSIERLTQKNYPISWTESEPFNAKDWWPCKDNPADKLDSADLIFTCLKPYMVGSNGLITHVVDHDTSQTFYWHESYPIDHYLLAFVCTEFDTLTHWHHFADGDSMKIMNFLFPGSADTMGASYIIVDSTLDLYEKWFGPYAFRNEKYGIAMWHGGGMENETLSFCNDGDSGIIAHETSHQWFGDAITCKTWNDTWLNEGFAVYTTDLFQKHYDGTAFFDTVIKIEEDTVTDNPGGTVYTPDSLLLKGTLSNRLVYCKGALLLHMLNFVLGSDTAYFRALREYVTGPLRYGVASAEDFQDAVEKASGLDLSWFFSEWVYGDGYPMYSLNWDVDDALHPAVAISQKGSTSASPLFTMPMQFEFIGDGIDTIVQVMNNQTLQAYDFTLSKPVNRMIFDPNNWLLDGELPRTLSVQSAQSNIGESIQVIRNLNSFDIIFSTAKPGETAIQMYDNLGRNVATINGGVEDAGQHSVSWHPVGLSNGVYYCRLLSDGLPVAFDHFILTQGE